MKKCKKKQKTPVLNKLSTIIKQNTGVGFHRLLQPAAWMERNGLVREVQTTRFTGDGNTFRIGKPRFFKGSDGLRVLTDKELIPICKNTDVIWTTTIYDIDEIFKILDIREWTGGKWIIDMDDNIYAVSNDNPAQVQARKLEKNLETCFRLADGLTVSVPMLKELYSPLNKNIYVQKNALNFNYWKTQPKESHKGIRIGWEGAYGHKTDVELIYPIIERLIKDYPEKNIQFVTFGIELNVRSEYHHWVSLQEYPEKMAELDLDIAIAPLIDSSYNRCKSNIRILEYSALKYPVVASPTENQRGLPCLYAKNNFDWYEQLERLILDKRLREEIGQKQYDFVKENYDVSKSVDGLAEWMSQLPRRDDISPKNVPKMR